METWSVLSVKHGQVTPPAPATCGLHGAEQWHMYKPLKSWAMLSQHTGHGAGRGAEQGSMGRLFFEAKRLLMDCHFHCPTLWFSPLKLEHDLLLSSAGADLSVSA